MLAQIFSITAPVFLLALAGYFWARMRAPFDLDFVTRLSLTFSVPCLIFATLVRAEIDPAAFRDIAVASLVAYAAITLAVAPILWLGGLSQRTFLAPVIFGNTGNVGLPVALFAYGEQGLALAMVVFAVMAILSFTVGIYMVAGVGRPSEALKQPLVYASILGGLFAVMDWDLPEWLMSALGLAGQIAIPLMLLTLGVSIARLRVGDIGRAALVSIAKYAVCAGVAFATARAVGLPEVAAGVLLLQLAMPVAVTNYMLAARYKCDPDAVAGLVVVSTVLSLGVIPAALAFLL